MIGIDNIFCYNIFISKTNIGAEEPFLNFFNLKLFMHCPSTTIGMNKIQKFVARQNVFLSFGSARSLWARGSLKTRYGRRNYTCYRIFVAKFLVIYLQSAKRAVTKRVLL